MSVTPVRRALVGVGAMVVFVMAGSAVLGAIPGADGTINGCYNSKDGELRVVESSDSCVKGETPITWNQQGPQGVPGVEGPQGVPGVEGPPGPASLAALDHAPCVMDGIVSELHIGTNIDTGEVSMRCLPPWVPSVHMDFPLRMSRVQVTSENTVLLDKYSDISWTAVDLAVAEGQDVVVEFWAAWGAPPYTYSCAGGAEQEPVMYGDYVYGTCTLTNITGPQTVRLTPSSQ